MGPSEDESSVAVAPKYDGKVKENQLSSSLHSKFTHPVILSPYRYKLLSNSYPQQQHNSYPQQQQYGYVEHPPINYNYHPVNANDLHHVQHKSSEEAKKSIEDVSAARIAES